MDCYDTVLTTNFSLNNKIGVKASSLHFENNQLLFKFEVKIFV